MTKKTLLCLIFALGLFQGGTALGAHTTTEFDITNDTGDTITAVLTRSNSTTFSDTATISSGTTGTLTDEITAYFLAEATYIYTLKLYSSDDDSAFCTYTVTVVNEFISWATVVSIDAESSGTCYAATSLSSLSTEAYVSAYADED
jgi:hypothetical protein